MCCRLRTVLALSLLLLLPLPLYAQKKIYTRKQQLQDFPARTVKVVLSGGSMLDTALKDEVQSRWILSPYEFCSVGDYGKLSGTVGLYFLRQVSEDSIVWLSLSKGGPTSDPYALDAGFEVVRLPIAEAGVTSGREFLYMPAFIDMIQNFVSDARESEVVAMLGLKSYKKRPPKGAEVLSGEDADRAFAASVPGAVLDLTVSGEGSRRRYQLLFTADSHELLHFGGKKNF